MKEIILHSLPDVAKRIPCSIITLYRYRNKGFIPTTYIEQRHYIKSDILIEWLPLIRTYIRLKNCCGGYAVKRKTK